MASKERNSNNYYGVAVGKKPGIYTTWGQCHKQTNRVADALFEGFENIADCVNFMKIHSEMQESEMHVFDDRGRPTALQEYIRNITHVDDDIEDDDDADNIDNNDENNADATVIMNPVLSYIVFAMQNGTVMNLKRAVAGHFPIDHISDAKDMLFSKCDIDIIGSKKIRRMRDGDAKIKIDNEIQDIIEAINKLDKAEKMPIVVIRADQLHMIPRSNPEELNSISVVDRLNKMEQKMSQMQDTIDSSVAKNLELSDRLHAVENTTTSYAAVTKKNERIISNPPRDEHVHEAPNATSVQQSGLFVKLPTRPYKPDVPRIALQRTQSRLSVASNQSSTSHGFEQTRHERKRLKRISKVITGKTPTNGNFKGAPEPDRYLFIHRVDKTVDSSAIKDHLCKNNITVRDLVCLAHDEAKYKSFKLTVPVHQFSSLFDENLWPNGVRVRKYTPPRSHYADASGNEHAQNNNYGATENRYV